MRFVRDRKGPNKKGNGMTASLMGRRTVAVLATGFLLSLAARAAALNACDLDANGIVNTADVDLAAGMVVGQAPCSANIIGAGVCNAVVIQRVINATSGACVVGTARSVVLNWTASVSANVVGYKVYRATTSGGPYTLLTATPVAGTTFTDDVVQGGVTYYYVLTAIDSGGAASVNSTEVSAAIP
jgi:hypothetical protein